MPSHARPRSAEDRRPLERFLRARAGRARAPISVAVLAGAIGGIALIAQAWLLARAIDAVAIRGASAAAVREPLALLAAAIGVRAAAGLLADSCAFEAGARVRLSVRAAAEAHIRALGPAWARRQRSGEVTGTVFDAVESIGVYYAGYLPQRALVAFVPLAILAFAIPTDWVSAVILAVTAPLIPLFMVLIGRGTEALNRAQWRRLARLAGHLFDAIEGLTTLKLFGASRAEADALARSSEDYRRATMEVLRVAFLSSLALEFLATIGVAMVAVYVGLRLYYRELDFLPGFAVLLLAPEFYRPLRAMGAQYHARMEAIGAAESIVSLFAAVPPASLAGDRPIAPGRVRAVAMERVSFEYDGAGAPALDAVDLRLEAGRMVALVGRSGAGKSTILGLLLGFLTPGAGRIAIDGADLSGIDPAAWRARIAWMPQHPTVFAGSVLDNVRLGRPDADEASVRRALERAGAGGFVDALPRGIRTAVGERGQGLSGGQVQRIALARVFLADADFVLLDEPGTALDDDAAALVGRSIASLARTRAVLVIAHRPETIAAADEVVVLDRGRVVERGPPGALASRPDGAFARLARAPAGVTA